MSKEKYLEVQDQLGREPEIDRCPPGIEDFPQIVVDAIEIFNYLGDRKYPEIGYVGKDYTSLPILMELYEIDNRELFLSLLLRLDSFVIQKSQEHLKREYDKLKRK